MKKKEIRATEQWLSLQRPFGPCIDKPQHGKNSFLLSGAAALELGAAAVDPVAKCFSSVTWRCNAKFGYCSGSDLASHDF